MTSPEKVESRWDPLVRWARRSPLVWIPIALVALVVLALLVERVEAWIGLDTTAISILVGFLGGFAAFVERAKTEERFYTVSLLQSISTSETLAGSDSWMAERLHERSDLTEEHLDDQGRFHLVNLLDYYEFLAVLDRKGVVDGSLVRSLRGPAMSAAFRAAEPYINSRRQRTGNEMLYARLERFARDQERLAARQERSR